MRPGEWCYRLKEILKGSDSFVVPDEPLAQHTSFRIGGKAALMVVVNKELGLRKVRQFCTENRLLVEILGKGTNVLISDQGIPGVVVKLGGEFGLIDVQGDKIMAGAAASLDDISEIAEANGLAGAEFLAGIPGTVGGGLVTNAGAYGKSLSAITLEVTVMDAIGNIRVLRKEELKNQYRQPVIPGEFWALRLVLILSKGETKPVKAIREERRSKHPPEPSAGSFFKNPPGIPAGRLIEECGLKGLRVGDACISELHANFIVNKGSARFGDVYELAQIVKAEVEERTGIELEEEVRFLPVGPERR
ncbi:MAG: UDP-N-acetylmuramate dehydrogenase [candidate division WOR-3 bacterium]